MENSSTNIRLCVHVYGDNRPVKPGYQDPSVIFLVVVVLCRYQFVTTLSS